MAPARLCREASSMEHQPKQNGGEHHGHAHHGHAHHEPAKTPGTPPAAGGGTIYTCPMHPQVRQPAPGNCPICGMALEPVMPTLEEGENAELTDFRRRFWWTLP